MRRGDVVTVEAAGDYGKPRPAVIWLASEVASHGRQARLGHLNDRDIARLNVALAFVMGLAD